jgi:oxidase EvaA
VNDPAAWLAERARAYRYEVTRVPLAELPRWHLGDELSHDTRRFFSVDGIAVATSFGKVARWTQPIIQQPEIGILGFLAKRIAGTLHLLAQAKMEPGNRVMVQISPTVQATPSNYTRVHGGRPTPFLDYFLGATRGRVLADLLQSEQGSRYFRKRNRSMIVEIPEHEELEHGEDFAWLTLGHLRELLAAGTSVNMNARSVLSCAYYEAADPADDREVAAMLTWLHDVKTEMQLDVRRIRLGDLEDWICDGESIRHASGNFFRVIGVDVRADGGREITAWRQPMLEPVHPGTVAFLCQRHGDRLDFLVHARAEPGFIDRVELGATLQLSPGNYADPSRLPPFAEYLSCPPEWVRFRAAQADDGGRFFHDDTMHLVIEVPEHERIELPPGFRWTSLRVLRRLMRCGYVVDIEARSLLACLGDQ